MKLTDYIIVFLIIFGSFGLITFYNTNLNSKTGITETEYANALAVACQDAARTIKTEDVTDGVWQNAEDREYTLNTFYNTLNFCFNTEYTEKSDETKKYTPIVCLIDNNGYYLSYNTVLDHTESVYLQDSSGSMEDGYSFNSKSEAAKDKNVKAYYESMIVTPINTWSENYGEIKVRFYLDNTVEIVSPSGQVLKKRYSEIIKDYKDDAPFFKSLSYSIAGSKVPVYEVIENGTTKTGTNTLKAILEDKLIYENIKNKVITASITDEVNYYINHQNIYNRNEAISYDYYMPEIAQEDWHRLLSNPTVISFLQGRQASTGEIVSNIYSIGGGEITKEGKYYITRETDGTYLYHFIPYVELEETVEFSSAKTDETHINCTHVLREYPMATSSLKKEDSRTAAGVSSPASKDEKKFEQIYECDGIKIDTTFNSMAECASLGAEPCDCVKNHN